MYMQEADGDGTEIMKVCLWAGTGCGFAAFPIL